MATVKTEQVVDAVFPVANVKTTFESLIKTRIDMIATFKSEVVELKKMQKEHEQLIKKTLSKKHKKALRANDAPRAPSGFASPVVVSDELYAFLEQFGVKKGEAIARTSITKHITTYIKQHNLQNTENRREVFPDATLLKILGDSLELKDPSNPNSQKFFTFLKLQKYLSPHFPKKQVPVTPST